MDAAVIDTTTITITPSEYLQTVNLEGFGIKLEIPPGAVPQDTHKLTFEVLAISKCNLKSNMEIVSCVYHVKSNYQFAKPVIMYMQHCVQLNNETDSKNLFFATSKDENLPYAFRRVGASQKFLPSSCYGEIEVSQFSFFTTLWENIAHYFTSCPRLYVYGVYCQPTASLRTWNLSNSYDTEFRKICSGMLFKVT